MAECWRCGTAVEADAIACEACGAFSPAGDPEMLDRNDDALWREEHPEYGDEGMDYDDMDRPRAGRGDWNL